MKIENIKKYGRERFLDIKHITSKKGDGTQNNPFLIENADFLPEHLQIRESHSFLQIQHCNLHSLIIKKCENVTISKCECQDLSIQKSAKIRVNDSKFTNAFGLVDSQNIEVQDCSINLLTLTHSHNNSISNCTIEDAMSKFSRANTFQNLYFSEKPEKLKNELLKSSISRKIHYLTILTLITITILVTLRLGEFGLGQALIFLLVMISVTLLYLGENFVSYLSTRKYAPNKLL